MNSENFHEYVKNPSMLHQVSYQELKSLVLQYPYSPNLRYLLLLKSLLDQNKDFDKNQVVASLASPDRKRLRQLVKQYTKLREIHENYALSEDFLELKDLSVLEKLIEEPDIEDIAPATEASKAEAVPQATAAPIANLEDLDEEIEEESDLSFLSSLRVQKEDLSFLNEELGEVPDEVLQEEVPAPESDISSLDGLLEMDDLAEEPPVEEQQFLGEVSDEILQEEVPAPESDISSLDGLLEMDDLAEETPVEEHQFAEGEKQGIAEAASLDEPSLPSPARDIPLEITNEPDLQPAPKPRSSFNSWLKQLTPPKASMLKGDLKDISLNSRQMQHPEPAPEADAKQVADQSVEEDSDIASETLALLFEKQKLYSRAISMYRRLGLLYPEKSSLFAAKIEELNKKL